jgi:hypothetical protein
VQDGNRRRWPDLLEVFESHYGGKVRGPTIAMRDDGTVVTRWWKGLDFHRDPGGGPANIEEKGACRIEEYWVDGKLHRPWEQGPAEIIVEEIDGKMRRVEAYWFEGRRHRPYSEGPALIVSHYGDNHNLSGEEYFEHGQVHRPSHVGPAVTQWDSSGRKVLQEFREHGELHRDPAEGPASFLIRDAVTLKGCSDDVTAIQYSVRGKNHRDENDGPAFISRDNRTGTIVAEQYYRDGRIFRTNGPAIVDRDLRGIILYEAWCDGKDGFNRDPRLGPAVFMRDVITGVTTEEYWVDGDYRRGVQGPSRVKRDACGRIFAEDDWGRDGFVPREFA